MRGRSASVGRGRAGDGGRRLAPALVCLLGVLVGCTVDPGPIVAPGTVVASDPSVRWVARIAWSDDGDELAFLGAAVGGPTLVYRAALDDASTSVSVVEGARDVAELRYLPGGRDLVLAGGTSAGAGACDRGAVLLVRAGAAPIALACPFDVPYHVLGTARDGAVAAVVDPDQFVAVAADGATIAVPAGGEALLVDLATLAATPLGSGLPVTFDPAGEHLVVVDFDPDAWALQPWRVVSLGDGARVALPIDEARFERGYHVFGVRWLADGLTFLVERDADDGAEWALWEVERDAWRSLGSARAGVGAFPLGRVPRWSASGRVLAFRTYECVRAGFGPACAEPRWSIVVVDVDSGLRTLAYRGRSFVDVPAIAPDDGSVVYAVDGVIYRTSLP